MNYSADSPMTSWNDIPSGNGDMNGRARPSSSRRRVPLDGGSHVNVTTVNHYGPSYFGNNRVNYESGRSFKRSGRRSTKRRRHRVVRQCRMERDGMLIEGASLWSEEQWTERVDAQRARRR